MAPRHAKPRTFTRRQRVALGLAVLADIIEISVWNHPEINGIDALAIPSPQPQDGWSHNAYSRRHEGR